MMRKGKLYCLHHWDNVNLMSQCFRYAKLMFPMSSLVCSLEAMKLRETAR
jgi:hypothetical protein